MTPSISLCLTHNQFHKARIVLIYCNDADISYYSALLFFDGPFVIVGICIGRQPSYDRVFGSPRHQNDPSDIGQISADEAHPETWLLASLSTNLRKVKRSSLHIRTISPHIRR